MNEVLPIPFPLLHGYESRRILPMIKRILCVIWKPIGWLLEAMFTPPPGQRYIEEQRLRAVRLTGHF